MLIRSQDKTMLVSHDTGLWAVNGSDIRFLNLYNTDKWMLFGRYENQDKAVKVLDMIEKSYMESLWTESHYDYSSQANVSDVIANNVVFFMPQDAEVEV